MQKLGIEKEKTLSLRISNVETVQVYSQNATFVFNQAIAAADWQIIHNLNKYPSVTIVDSARSLVMGSVEYVSANELIVHFSAPFSGSAYLN